MWERARVRLGEPERNGDAGSGDEIQAWGARLDWDEHLLGLIEDQRWRSTAAADVRDVGQRRPAKTMGVRCGVDGDDEEGWGGATVLCRCGQRSGGVVCGAAPSIGVMTPASWERDAVGWRGRRVQKKRCGLGWCDEHGRERRRWEEDRSEQLIGSPAGSIKEEEKRMARRGLDSSETTTPWSVEACCWLNWWLMIGRDNICTENWDCGWLNGD